MIVFIGCSSNTKKSEIANKKADLYYGQGTYYLAKKMYTKALSHLLEARKLNPKDSRIYTNLAMAYYFKNRIETAKETLIKAIELDPKNDDARLNLATIYMQQNDFTNAYNLYRQLRNSLTYEKQDQVLYNMAILEFKRNDYRQGVTYLKRSLEENEFYCPSTYKYGMLAYERKNYSEALIRFKKAIKGNCYQNPAAHFYLGLSYIKNDKTLQGITQLEELRHRFPSSQYAEKANKEIQIANTLLSVSEKQEMELSKKYNAQTPKF